MVIVSQPLFRGTELLGYVALSLSQDLLRSTHSTRLGDEDANIVTFDSTGEILSSYDSGGSDPRMLLPVKKIDTGEEVEDPRAELARRLLEYERIKVGAARLDAIPQDGRDFMRAQVHVEQTVVVRLPEVDPADLKAAWADILKRARLVQHHKIEREELSVREHMSNILRALKDRRFAEFSDLFDVGQGVPVVVVTFIAMLELARENLLQVTQAAPFAPIYVRLAYQPS